MARRCLVLLGLLLAAAGLAPEGEAMGAETFVLENARVRLAFDAGSGALTELRAANGGLSCLAPGVRVPPVQVAIWDREKGALLPLPGGEPVLGEAKVTRRGGRQSLALSFALAGGAVSADCSVSIGEDAISRWRIRVRNGSPYRIASVGFPYVPAQIGPASADDVLIYPLVYGERQANPLKLGGVVRAYPGPASMQWMDLHDAAGGLYVASYDKTSQSTDVSALPYPAAEPRALVLSFAKYGLIAPGGEWESAHYVVAPHPGDWHCGADRYREWRATWMRRPPTPRWLRESDGWFGTGYHAAFAGSLRGSYEGTLPGAAARAAGLGLSHLEVWGQMVAPASGKHSCGLYVGADPAQGGGDALARVNEALRRQGQHTGYYMHAWASSPGLHTLMPEPAKQLPKDETEPSWKVTDAGSQHADEAGRIATDHIRVMCPSAPDWQSNVRFWVLDRYVRQYRATGMYLDVLSIEHRRCFSDKHGPLHVGDWGRDAAKLLATLRKEGKRAHPDFFLAGEGVCDVYGQYLDAQLISRSCMLGGWVPHPCPEVIRYTCPDLLLLEGFANGIGPDPRTGQPATPEYVIGHAHLLGNRFDLYDLGEPGLLEYASRALALRRQLKGFLYRARFMDDVGLAASPGLRAKWFASGPGSEQGILVTLSNDEGRDGLSVSLAGVPPAAGGRATAYVLDGEPRDLSVARSGDRVRFTAPREALSAVLIR